MVANVRALASSIMLVLCLPATLLGCTGSNAASTSNPSHVAAQRLPDTTTAPVPAVSPAASSLPLPVPAPAPTPNPFHYVTVPPPPPAPSVAPASEQEKAPQILEIDLNERELSAPGPLSVRVVTSINVNGVWARVAGRERGIPPTHAGLFEASDQLPRMPFFLKGKEYTVDFVAKTVDGRETVVSIPIFIKR